MYPRYHQRPMQYQVPPQSFHPYQRMSPTMGGMMRPRQLQQRSGGLLSRLFGGLNQSGARQGIRGLGGFGQQFAGGGGFGQQAAGGGGLLRSLTNPNTINNFLTNTQKVLNTANQVGPLVHQYGPVVKNLPMMWKLYRGLKDAPEFNGEQDESSSSKEEEQTNITFSESSDSVSTESKTTSRYQASPSKPKLYI
ncbi:VrrA/YqfQ family protein [Niallia sp. XMNu-256]|uniref:VrrA/YqfQ family protein n=1 Tax=Niallia sp. XMNu-256 TaxID=3082444 RepID=UPI0030D2792B